MFLTSYHRKRAATRNRLLSIFQEAMAQLEHDPTNEVASLKASQAEYHLASVSRLHAQEKNSFYSLQERVSDERATAWFHDRARESRQHVPIPVTCSAAQAATGISPTQATLKKFADSMGLVTKAYSETGSSAPRFRASSEIRAHHGTRA